jgi:hypothetical protein
MSAYRNLEFSNFPLTLGQIIIPSDTVVVYRGAEKNPSTCDSPLFFSERNVADVYAIRESEMEKQRTVFPCLLSHKTGNRPIRLVDLRCLAHIFTQDMLYTGREKSYTPQQRVQITQTLFATGHFTMNMQLNILKCLDPQTICHFVKEAGFYEKFVNENAIGERPGYRISLMDIDDTMVWLFKTLYGDIIDGYIAPQLDAPWYSPDRFHQEICLFKPSDCIKVVSRDDVSKTETIRVKPNTELCQVTTGLEQKSTQVGGNKINNNDAVFLDVAACAPRVAPVNRCLPNLPNFMRNVSRPDKGVIKSMKGLRVAGKQAFNSTMNALRNARISNRIES